MSVVLLETRTRMRRWRCDEQCHIVPSPLVGEGQGEGWATRHCARNDFLLPTLDIKVVGSSTPLPVPPPQGGRERCGTALPIENAALAYLPQQSAAPRGAV